MSDPPFETMNETDVREAILRPLLHDLGWKIGTKANIRTEITLSYRKVFLGHKKEKDPDLVGRADYICDLIGVARWIVEAKAPSHDLTKADVQQAHTYASHPEVNATYFLLSNGRVFQLYQTSYIDQPILTFSYGDLERRRSDLLKVLSPQGLRDRHTSPLSPRARLEDDGGIALAPGWGPQVKIVGGALVCKGVLSADASRMLILRQVIGRRGYVMGEFAYRTPQRDIRVDLRIVQATADMDELGKLMGLEKYSVQCADRIISGDVEHPTVFAGQVGGVIPANVDLSKMPGVPQGTRLPWPIGFVVDMRAVGFLQDSAIHGTYAWETNYHIDFSLVPEQSHAQLRHHLSLSKHSMWGEFELRLMPVSRSGLPSDLDVIEAT
jgi:hypothetical protein